MVIEPAGPGRPEAYTLLGDRGHACLLLHGLGGGSYELRPLGEALHGRGFTVDSPLYPGHDEPGPIMPSSTWRQWLEKVEARFEALLRDHAEVSVVGFSTGCPLALRLAARREVSRLVLLSPFLAIRHRWYYLLPPAWYLATLGRLIGSVPRRPLAIRDRRVRREVERSVAYRTFDLASARSALELIREVKAEVPRVLAPTLILQPRRDSIVDPSGAAWLADRLGSPDRRLVWLERSDHLAALDLERDEVLGRTLAFLEESA